MSFQNKKLTAIVKEADILVGAVGVPKLIKSDWIKPGAVVIDAGYHPQEKCGDIDLEGIESQPMLLRLCLAVLVL